MDKTQVGCFHKIQVCGETDRSCGELFSLLECVFPVRFERCDRLISTAVGETVLLADAAEGEGEAVSGLMFPRREIASATPVIVDFSDESTVPFPFRGRSLRVNLESAAKELSPRGTEAVLARVEGRPVWTIVREGGSKYFRSAFALPTIPPSGGLQDVLNGNSFLEILPLLHWLREVVAASTQEGPSLRASFIFDDPNLHWPRYGWIDYREVAAHAEKENYHVSFATIPLDAWYTHRPTSAIFRANSHRLSLLFHGNDHVKDELARAYTPPVRDSLLSQAVRRIERLEQASGVPVSRVMVPPHGACSDEMLAALPKRSFESACISHGSLRFHNRSRAWTKTVGILPSELIQDCPVLPRWSLTRGDVGNSIVLAAFLNQPLILRGHHQDLKQGPELLDQFARLINSLGKVTWGSLSELSRMNFQQKIEGDTFRLRPLGRKVVCTVPEGVTKLRIETPIAGQLWENWVVQAANGKRQDVRSGCVVSLSGMDCTPIMATLVTAPIPVAEACSKRWSAPAFMRRLLTEGRDRFFDSRLWIYNRLQPNQATEP